MKILVIPDLHGKDCWKEIVNVLINDVDKIIFLGDYVDSFDKTDVEITTNLQDIIEFKTMYMDKVTLLLGNHDIQYIYGYSQYGCSGFRAGMFASWNHLLTKNIKLFQMAYQHRNWLFTHAGISSGWMRRYEEVLNNPDYTAGAVNLADKLNRIADTGRGGILYTVGERRGGFRGDLGGITWADIGETSIAPLEHYHQVVGHSKIKEMARVDNGTCSICYTDILDKNPRYLLLDLTGEPILKCVDINLAEYPIKTE